MLRTLFLTSVETSRACSQLEGGFCAKGESLEPAASKLYGGEVVTFKLLELSALRCQLFLKEMSSSMARGSPTPSMGLSDLKGPPRRTPPLASDREARRALGGATPRRGSGGEGKNPRGGTSPRRARLG